MKVKGYQMELKRTTVKTKTALHIRWKLAASLSGKTMDEYAQAALEEKISRDTKPDQADALRKIVEERAV